MSDEKEPLNGGGLQLRVRELERRADNNESEISRVSQRSMRTERDLANESQTMREAIGRVDDFITGSRESRAREALLANENHKRIAKLETTLGLIWEKIQQLAKPARKRRK